MNVEIKNVDQIVRHMSVIVDKETQAKDYQKALKRFSKEVQIDGFRKGKAPIATIEKFYGARIEEYYLEEFVDVYFRTALEKVSVRLMSQPAFINVSQGENGETIFVFEYETLPENFEYEYKNLEVPFEADKYTEDKLDTTITYLLNENAEEVPFEEDQTIEVGDKIKLLNLNDQEEVPFFYLNEKELSAKLSVDMDKIVSLKMGDRFQDGEIDYQIIDAFKRIVPELNDDTAKILGHENVKAMKSALKENITNEIEARNTASLNFSIAEAFGKKNRDNVKIPDEYLKNAARKMIVQYFGGQMDEDFIDKIEDDVLLKAIEPQIPNIVWDLSFEQIAKDNNISVSDEDFDNEIVKLSSEFNMSVEDFRARYKRNMDGLREDLLSRKVLEFIKPHCIITNVVAPENSPVVKETASNEIEDAEFEVVEEKPKRKKKKEKEG